MNLALRIYLRLAEAFPHEFKLVYGTDVMQLGEDVVEEIAKQNGIAGLIRLIADIAIRVPMEYLSEMRRDLRYAVRALIKSPGFALVGIISLGLGMGITTSVFSKMWAQLFRDLPRVTNPGELAMPQNPVSYYYIEQFRAQKSLLAGVAAFQNGVPFNVGFPGNGTAKPERVFGQLVSPEYFSVLGVKPQRGRVLNPDLDKPGSAPSVVITDRFWRNRLNSSPDALGQTLRLNGQPATIVGITPQGFKGVLPSAPTELFVPVTVSATLAPELANDVLHKRDAKVFQAIIRLAHGVTIESAEAGLDTVTRNLDQQDPTNPNRNDKARRVTLLEGGTVMPMPRDMKPVVVGFLAVLIGLVLTIACMNLANMLLARGAARRKELAIRLAIGASRFRLIRQMMSEGILIAMLGGVAGFGLAYWLSILSSQMKLPQAVPQDFDPGMDWRALVFTFILAIVCGIGFSLAPALQATRADVAPTLKEGAAIQLRGYRRFGMRNVLVVGQVAGSLMLLLITGFLVIGINKMSDIQTKFDAHTMYLLSIDPVRDGYAPEKAQALFEKLPARLKAVGAVRSIALAAEAPFSLASRTAKLTVAKDSSDPSPTIKLVSKETVGAGYFAALSEPMLAGREFSEADQRIEIPSDGSNAVDLPIVLNQSAAHGLFGNGNAIGQRVTEDRQSYDVVGLVSDLKTGIPDEEQPASVMYLPLTRRDFATPPAGGMVIMVRSDAGVDALGGIRREIVSMDPNLAIFDVRTLGEYLDMTRAIMRLSLEVYGGMGVFGLVLAAIGLAGVTAYAVARRRKEIGIRMALGARKAQVLRLVLREGATLVTVGTVLGFLGTMLIVKALSALTSIFADSFNVTTNDPRLIVGAPLLLAALALLACYIPARRSAKIDPVKALRQE
ncbi:MAG TPA: ABC transporter permease [Bryobacteraceae bacterium]|jgi:predicted permease|nr:ABC transporter permease [Bryobacteraceae bacterium]